MGHLSIKERLLMLREEYKVKDICSAMSVCRSRYYRSLNEPWPKAKVARPVFHVDGTSMADEAVLERMKKIQTDHPFWGYRRITAWLQHREGKPLRVETAGARGKSRRRGHL